MAARPTTTERTATNEHTGIIWTYHEKEETDENPIRRDGKARTAMGKGDAEVSL
jgi:hypothetical protein